MRVIAFGGDERMHGTVMAAKRAGWEAVYACRPDELPDADCMADAVILPWPVSFREERLVGTDIGKEQVLARIPPCRMIVHGAGTSPDELAQAQSWLNPVQDEAFLRYNAQLTAEGAICRAMMREGCALLNTTALVTGFGRIGQELTKRLVALGVFVIVCARNESQMRQAHDMGAHPMALVQLAAAVAQAEVIFNTVPARILDERILSSMDRNAMIIELASAPYGVDMELAARMGVKAALESGLPARYAPLDAGAAVFDAMQRALQLRGIEEGGRGNG